MLVDRDHFNVGGCEPGCPVSAFAGADCHRAWNSVFASSPGSPATKIASPDTSRDTSNHLGTSCGADNGRLLGASNATHSGFAPTYPLAHKHVPCVLPTPSHHSNPHMMQLCSARVSRWVAPVLLALQLSLRWSASREIRREIPQVETR
jgi:hypothetical protein